MGRNIHPGAVRRKLGTAAAAIFFGIAASAAGAADPVFASPLPPGPGQVPALPGPLVAPVLMPLMAPTASPAGAYSYGSPTGTGAGDGGPSPVSAACGDGAAACGHRVWVAADYLYGAAQGSGVPPLITSAPAGTPGLLVGGLGQPSTRILFGGRREGNEFRPGFRLGAGFWLDETLSRGFDASYFFLGRRSDGILAVQPAAGGSNVYQPVTGFINNVFGNFGFDIGFAPAYLAASVTTDVTGADVNYRHNLADSGTTRLDLTAGYRYVFLGDDVRISNFRSFIGGPLVGFRNFFAQRDELFQTRNHFHGGQIGAVVSRSFASGFSAELRVSCALGATNTRTVISSLEVNEFSTIVNGGNIRTSPFSNIGTYTSSYFAVVPEAVVRLGYDLTDRVRITAGYSFLYWSKVQRAADQIDLTLSMTRPAYTAQTTDYWVQGWTMGLEVRY